MVYTIDGEPALDVFIKYLGLPEAMDPRKDVVNHIAVQFPLHVFRTDGHAVVRTPLTGNADNRSLTFAGAVAQGSKAKFCVPPSFDVIETTIERGNQLKIQHPDADAVILFSCKARHTALGPMIEEEVAGIQRLWDAPLIGFFSYGEIGPINNRVCEFHNQTCSLVTIRKRV